MGQKSTYFADINREFIQPSLDFIKPVTDFMTSGSNRTVYPAQSTDNTLMSYVPPTTRQIMDEEQNYAIPSSSPINAVATPYTGMNEQQNYENTYTGQNGNSNIFNSNQQINPAGTSSPDGMMTMPTNYLYPGEAIGIDGVPYRPNAGASTANSGNGGGNSSSNTGSSTPVADVLGTRQFNQRAPSGSIYAPDMSAYNDSSLFNYTGQGGVPEYTYGQGLRTGGAYSEYGTPADMANPYFSGQFKVPDTVVNPINTGPADAAINMNPVVMPAGVPAVGSNTITPRPPNSAGDLTYQQTIDSMGIFGPNNPPPSTPFPSPGGATTLANLGLTERQIAQMSPQQQAYMTQALANQNRMQQGQINKNKEIANIANSPDTSMMENQAAADIAMGNRTGYPNQVVDRTTEILAAAEANGGVIDGTEVVDGNTGIDAFRESFLRNRSLDREQQNVYGGLDGMFGPYGLHNNEPEGIFAGMPPERDSFKADEIDIPTPPFRPEGVEGVDYYQDVTGDYFAMEDDLGTQALKPVDPFAGMPPERDFFKPDEAGIDKPANLPSYEADGDIESTSGNMSALSDSFAAIDAKYAGSTTEASKNAELQDIIGVIINEFEGMKIEELALTPDAPYAEPSYRFADEGQDTGEFTSSFMGGGTPFDNPYVAPPLEDVVNPSNVAEIMFGIDTAMPQNGVRSQDNTMTMPTFREDVLPAPVYTPVPQPVVQPRPVYNTPTNAGPPGRNYSAPKVSTPRRSNYRFVGGR